MLGLVIVCVIFIFFQILWCNQIWRWNICLFINNNFIIFSTVLMFFLFLFLVFIIIIQWPISFLIFLLFLFFLNSFPIHIVSLILIIFIYILGFFLFFYFLSRYLFRKLYKFINALILLRYWQIFALIFWFGQTECVGNIRICILICRVRTEIGVCAIMLFIWWANTIKTFLFRWFTIHFFIVLFTTFSWTECKKVH